MKKKPSPPLAYGREKEEGWTYGFHFLCDVADHIRRCHGIDLSPEGVEQVILSIDEWGYRVG
jgi:hypothetical protein